MTQKQQSPLWEGLLNPARLLTAEEIEELGETCAVCRMAAHVVEVVGSITEEEKTQPLSSLDSTHLRFTCGLHSPIDVPQHVLDAIDLAFFQAMTQSLICPDKRWQKYYVTCLRLKPSCLKHCISIKGRLPDAISIDQACAMVERGQRLDAQRKKKKEEEDNAVT